MKLVFGHCYSGGILPTGLCKKVLELRPDVVYLHRLQLGTIGVKELLKMEGIPFIWCIHDLWPINGVCPYWDEGLFEIPITWRMRWLDRLARKVKRATIHKLVNNHAFREIRIASCWLKKVVEDSQVFNGVPIRMSPIALNACFVNKKLNEEPHVIGRHRFTVLFGAEGNVFRKVKGFDRLIRVIEILPSEMKLNVCISVFGVSDGPAHISGVAVEYLGFLSSEELVKVYHAADVLALTSRQETYGLVKHEALACGCPVVTFNETACPEGIIQGENGWISESNDYESFARGLIYFLERKCA